jgi:hypothetical protein
MEEKAKEEVAGYRKMFFWVFLGFSILLNYFAMASLFNQYRKKRKELTVDMIDELTDRLELMNAEKINKISLSTKAQKQKLEEKNIIDVEIEKETYNIVIAKRAKALMRKKEIPLKIMNNQNIMEDKKAGFVSNPFGEYEEQFKEMDKHEKNVRGLHDEDEMLKKFDSLIDKEESYQKEPKDFYSPTDEVGIFDKLFLEKEGKESDKMKGAEQKLNPKTKVIDITKRAETTALSRVYKKMVSRGIAELRGNKGYYSLMGYSDAFLAFRVTEDKKETDTYDFNLGDY